MNLCLRKHEVLLVLTVASQDSRSELELLPGALCAQVLCVLCVLRAPPPNSPTSWFVTSLGQSSPGTLRSDQWKALAVARVLTVLGSMVGATGLLFQPWDKSGWAGATPAYWGLWWVRRAEQDPGQQKWPPGRWPKSQARAGKCSSSLNMPHKY